MKKTIFFSLFFSFLLFTAPAVSAQEPTCMLSDMLYGENSGWSETSLGSAAADALVWETDAQAAILPGGIFRGNLRGGALTQDEIAQAVDSDVPLAVAQVTPAQLFSLLESGFSHLTLNERERLDKDLSDSDAFPQFSGIFVRADASAPPGTRIMSLTLDGSELTPEDLGTITLCAPVALLEACGKSLQQLPASRTVSAILYDYISSGALSQPPESRLELIGTLDDSFMDHFPPAALALVLAVIILFAAVSVRHNGRPHSRRYGTR